MKTTLFSTVGAIALTSLAITLAPATASAHGSSGGRGSSCKTSSHHNSCRPSGHRTCSSLPRGCRSTHYRGERCWYGGGNYYRCNPLGGYVIIDQPEVEYQETVVERPVVQRRVVVQQEVEEEQEEEISYLPESCETVYVGGERCWYSNGCYYRHCGHGYKKFHCNDRGHGRNTCKNDRRHNPNCKTSSRTCSTHNTGRNTSSRVGHHTSTSMSHNSSHNSGSKGGHSRR